MLKVIGGGLEAHVYREARERALNIVMEAQEEADRLVREAEERASTERATAIQRATDDLDDRRRQAMAQARLTARRASVSRRQALIDGLWASAEKALRTMADAPDDVRLQALYNLLEDAAAQLAESSWTMEIAVSSRDLALLSGDFLAEAKGRLGRYGVTQIQVAEASAPIIGGLVARKIGSRQIVDSSFEERLALARRMLRDEIERLLAGDEAPSAAQA